MAQARKLPSGAYQTRVTKVINGKKITKSFTVHPKQCKGDSRKAKDQSEMLARQWRLSAEDSETYSSTVGFIRRIDEKAREKRIRRRKILHVVSEAIKNDSVEVIPE